VASVNTSKAGLNNMLQAILAVVNEEQSAIYPPSVFSSQYNSVTALLIDKLVQLYPGSPASIDMLDPFMKFAMVPVKNGVIPLPDDYRNILGAPYIFINKGCDGECGKIPQITTSQQFLTANLKGGCKAAPITIVSEAEFSIRTSSTYKRPTHENPIGYFTGQKMIKICPYDLTICGLLYVVQEDIYQYGSIMQPDDTFIFDQTTTIDSPWTNAAFKPIFNALLSLYSAYVKDPEMTNWAMLIQKEGLL
jgi:hypothetical protein